MNHQQSSLTDRQSAWKWWVCGALLLATFLNYMDRQALAVTLPQLKRDFNLREERIGWVEGCFGYAFAAGALVFGLLADRLGPRRLYPIVLTGWSLAGIATGFAGEPQATDWLQGPDDEVGAGTFRWLLIWRTLLGLFEAGHWPCALMTAQRLLTAKDRTLGNGILQSGASAASILIPLYVLLLGWLGWGWQVVFWSIGIGGLLWVPLWLSLVGRNDLDGHRHEPDDHADAAMQAAPSMGKQTGVARRLVVLGIITTCLTISWQFLRAWLTLLLDFHGYGQWALVATSGYFIAAEIGCLLVGFVVLELVRRGYSVHGARVRTFAGYAALTAVAAVVPFVGSGWLMIVGLMLAGAGLLGLHPLYYALNQELSRGRMGARVGTLSLIGWGVSSSFQILIGKRIEQTKSYDVGLVITGLAPLVGLVALLVLWPAGRQRQPESAAKVVE